MYEILEPEVHLERLVYKRANKIGKGIEFVELKG